MKQQLTTLAVTLVAAVAAQLLATYLVNNVRSVRRIVGPL